MKRPGIALLATLGFVGLAHAADVLPTTKPAPPLEKPNCWGSFWTWLNTSADDCPIGAYGITLYGTLDVGFGYQTWGTTFNPSADKTNYGIQKSGHERLWLPTYNALSTSVLGLKMKEDLGPVGLPGWSLIGVLEAGISPYSGMFLNPPRSLADQNFSPANKFPWQTQNFDSSRNGSWMNSQGYIGISNKTFGQLTFGRTNSLSFDSLSKYDPVTSNAFSLIGFSNSFPGFGDTVLVRPNTAITYKVSIPNILWAQNIRIAAQAQVGGYNWQNGSQGAYYGQLGGDWGNFSFDGIVGWAKDAVSLSTFGGSNVSCLAKTTDCFIRVNNVNYDPNSVLKATLSNNFGVELMGSYKWDRFKFYGGYIYARLSNPSDDYMFGFRTTYPAVSVPYGAVTFNNYNFDKRLNTVWTGVKWSVSDNFYGYGALDLAAGFYYQTQNNFNFTVGKFGNTLGAACTGTGAFISSSKCEGSQDAVSVFADWRPFKRVDIYAGVMVSNVYGGLANGFTQTYTYIAPTGKPGKFFTATATTAHTQQWDPTIGIRIRF